MAQEEEVAGREPCPWRILDDTGAAFAMGAIGGSVYHAIKGYTNSPEGMRIKGISSAVRNRAPILGGSFALWGMFYSGYDCSLLGIREKDDIWNSITAGALTGGTLAVRHGAKAALRSAAIGGLILGVIEGIQLVFMNMFKDQYSPEAMAPQLPQLESIPAPPSAPSQ